MAASLMSALGQTLRSFSAPAPPDVRCCPNSVIGGAMQRRYSRHSLRRGKAVVYFTISYALPDGTHVPVEEQSTASKADNPYWGTALYARPHYLRINEDCAAGGVGAAGEIANVSQVFQPSARF
jgi:hypothetical protein